MAFKKDWYDDFLEEVNEMEASMKCPKCKSENIYHVDPFSYTFFCGSCEHSWKVKNGKYINQINEKFGKD